MKYVLGLILLLSAAVASAGHHGGFCGTDGVGRMLGGMGGMGHGRAFDRIASELALSPEQQDSIQGVMERYREQGAAVAESRRDALCALKEADPESADYAQITAEASAAASQLAGEAITLMSQMKAELHALLTPEQRAEWETLSVEMKERRQERRQRFRERDPRG
ncbi:MAG: Spy/CpxP family protein refolding chaperone [Pseudomonadota bacterium]